jgi:hypothetical protein
MSAINWRPTPAAFDAGTLLIPEAIAGDAGAK